MYVQQNNQNIAFLTGKALIGKLFLFQDAS